MDSDFQKDRTDDEEEAEKWLREGLAFLDKECLDQAYICFRQGIELSPQNALLQFALGQAFDAGLGVAKDDSKAVEWYQKAAEQGLMGAMYSLAQKLESGQGVQHDKEQAGYWHRLAAEGGLPDAQYDLGEHYLYEVEPVPRNWREAVKWFRKAAEQGHSNAQLRLAGMYEDGLGIPQDLSAAVFWFRKAADQGNVQAEAALEQYETD